MQKYEGRCKILFADQKVNVAAARDVYARAKPPKKQGASETVIWKSSGPMGQSSGLKVVWDRKSRERGVGGRQAGRTRDRGDEDGEFLFSCEEGVTVVSKGCSEMTVHAAA